MSGKGDEQTPTTTHDYTRRGWGHDFTFSPIDRGLQARMSGWGHGISVGDFLILPNEGGPAGSNQTTRYRIVEIRYESNPPFRRDL